MSRRLVIAGTKQGTRSSRGNLRSPEMREVAQTLATLASIKVRKGEPLNVRRREDVRRSVAEAGELLGWSELAALSSDPVGAAAKDVKKVVKSGLRALERRLADEVADKQAEPGRLEELLETVHSLADDPKADYPAEIVFSRTAMSSAEGLVTKTETLVVADPAEALKAAEKMERSLPKWEQLSEQMLDELEQKREHLEVVGRNLSELVESWRGLLHEVIVTMP